MILLVDHRDSFTFNVVQAFRKSGAEVRVVDHRRADLTHALEAEAIVLGPGPHGPDKVPESLALYREALGKIPVLGICLGMQIIGAAHGGRLRQATHVAHGVISEIRHDGTGIFDGINRPGRFVRYHSLVLDEPQPEELRITALDADGDAAALEHRRLPVWGVQFHPDSILSEQGDMLFSNFLALAGAWRERRWNPMK